MENPKQKNPHSLKKMVLLITYAILLFLLIYRFEAVWSWITWFFSAIAPLFIGLALAFVFHIPMDFFQYKLLRSWEHSKSRVLRKLWRGMSMLLAYCTVIAVLYGLGALIFPRVVESVSVLASNFGGYLKNFQSWADGFLSSLSVNPSLAETVSNLWGQATTWLQGFMRDFVSGALSFTVGLTAGIFDFVLAIMFSGFLLYNKETVFRQVRRFVEALVGEKRTRKASEVLRLTNNVFGKFVLGQVTEAIILGVLCFIGMLIFGMDYALLISTIIAVTALVPILGSFIGTIPCALILLVIDPMQAVWFVVFIIVLQQLEGNFIYPRVVGNAIGLSGLWVLVSLIVGGGLFGIWGMLLGTPIFAVLYHLIDRWLHSEAA